MLSLVLAAQGHAQDLMVYPAQGQSQEQQQRDEFECYNWAKQQSGFDCMAAPQATALGALGGAAPGAAIGGVGGAIAGNAGKGAAI